MVFADSASASDDEDDVRAGEALAYVVARGLFAAERRGEFDFRVYASSARELRDFLTEADAHASQAEGERNDAYKTDLYDRVQRITAPERTETEVAYHERAQITQLIPIGPECQEARSRAATSANRAREESVSPPLLYLVVHLLPLVVRRSTLLNAST